MDDANVPSLMSLPYIGFLGMRNFHLKDINSLLIYRELHSDAKNEIYQNTRKFLMSRDNP